MVFCVRVIKGVQMLEVRRSMIEVFVRIYKRFYLCMDIFFYIYYLLIVHEDYEDYIRACSESNHRSVS